MTNTQSENKVKRKMQSNAIDTKNVASTENTLNQVSHIECARNRKYETIALFTGQLYIFVYSIVYRIHY